MACRRRRRPEPLIPQGLLRMVWRPLEQAARLHYGRKCGRKCEQRGDLESRMRVDLLDLPRIALERWRMLAVGVVAGLALAFAFNANTRPVYESQTTLMLNGQVTLTDNSQAEAQNALSQDLVHTYAELIRARPVAEAVVARLQL